MSTPTKSRRVRLALLPGTRSRPRCVGRRAVESRLKWTAEGRLPDDGPGLSGLRCDWRFRLVVGGDHVALVPWPAKAKRNGTGVRRPGRGPEGCRPRPIGPCERFSSDCHGSSPFPLREWSPGRWGLRPVVERPLRSLPSKCGPEGRGHFLRYLLWRIGGKESGGRAVLVRHLVQHQHGSWSIRDLDKVGVGEGLRLPGEWVADRADARGARGAGDPVR